ncbi:hypothetical protein QBC43DRAFT_337167 [Cladorrhinum sp. PSN259]|nr:hypothetical protein QBC43DRAFT_337167 [Cladorrhinum sp. PSN259]
MFLLLKRSFAAVNSSLIGVNKPQAGGQEASKHQAQTDETNDHSPRPAPPNVQVPVEPQLQESHLVLVLQHEELDLTQTLALLRQTVQRVPDSQEVDVPPKLGLGLCIPDLPLDSLDLQPRLVSGVELEVRHPPRPTRLVRPDIARVGLGWAATCLLPALMYFVSILERR